MTGATIEIRDGELLAKFGKLLARFKDKTPLMARLAEHLVNATRERFETGEAPDGKRWKPSIRAQLQGGQTLLDRGILRDRITGAHGADFAAAGTNDIRAPIHQSGGTIRARKAKALAFRLPGANGMRLVQKVTIPARPFLGVSADDQVEIGHLIREYVAEAGR